jgi:DNA invertase Pin-like site-specific DNA recombinase
MIRDRVSAGKLQKKKLGRHVHGRVPYGYTSTGGILEPVEDLVPVVRGIYRNARDGWTPGRIARALNLRRQTLRRPQRPRGDHQPLGLKRSAGGSRGEGTGTAQRPRSKFDSPKSDGPRKGHAR